MIYTNYDGPESPMLQYQVSLKSVDYGYREEYFLKVFFGNVTWTIYTMRGTRKFSQGEGGGCPNSQKGSDGKFQHDKK